MAVTFQRVTVSTTPVALNSVSTAGVTRPDHRTAPERGDGATICLADGGSDQLRNESANAVDVGGSTVAAGTGMSLAANTYLPFPIDLDAGDQLYAIRSAASDGVVSVLRMI